MNTPVQIVIGFVAFLHLYFLWLEMFGWTSLAPKVFKGRPLEYFKTTKALAANQGLYNGFLSAGLIWTFFIEDLLWQRNIALFFLGCVLLAGIFGAITASKRIFWIQAFPALIGLVFLLLESL